MSWSSVKRLTNEMISIENNSSKFIPKDNYYIVKIRIDEQKNNEMKNLAELMLYSSPQPICVYYTCSEVDLVFSCVEEDEVHQFEGSHHRIVSHYAKEFARESKKSNIVDINIVELNSQTQVITYLGWVVFQTSQNAMQKLSDGKITDKLVHFRTEKELQDILTQEGVDWDKVSSFEKYGTFIRLRKKKDNVYITELSEQFDAREYKRYTSFIFG